MRLYEDTQEDIIASAQNILDIYIDLLDESKTLKSLCESDSDLSLNSKIFYDDIDDGLWEKVSGICNDILDKFYPLDYSEDTDWKKASEIYKNSKEIRDSVFDSVKEL